MKYAICNETFSGWDHARVCDLVASLGYGGLEIAPFTLAPLITDVNTAKRAEIRAHAETAGLKVIGLHWLLAKTTGFNLTSPDAEVRKRTGEYFSQLAIAAAELGGDILVLGSPLQRNVPKGHTYAESEDFACDTLSYCLKTLDDTNVKLCLEPLTPKETDFMNTAASAVAIIEGLAHPLVKLHLDVKAMAAEPASREETIRTFAPHTYHFHANDENLRGPGTGAIDFKPIFAALKESNYNGWVSVEVFDYTPDPETIARESIAYMRSCE
jgi:sugar phosphate isomerase/epimerase